MKYFVLEGLKTAMTVVLEISWAVNFVTNILDTSNREETREREGAREKEGVIDVYIGYLMEEHKTWFSFRFCLFS